MASGPRDESGGGASGEAPLAGAERPRAEEAIEAGLALYSKGDLIGALAKWRRALELDPNSRRARDYVNYVEDHFEILDETFRSARWPSGGPVGEKVIEIEADDPMDDDASAYESLEVEVAASAEEEQGEEAKEEGGGGAATGEAKPVGWRSRLDLAEVSSVDEGWSLDGIEETWSPARDDDERLELASSPYLDDLSDLGATPGIPEVGTGEITLPEADAQRRRRRASVAGGSVPPPQGGAERGGPDGFDLSDFDPPRDTETAEAAFERDDGGIEIAPLVGPLADGEDPDSRETLDVRVTFRAPQGSGGGAGAEGAAQGEAEEDAPTAEHRIARPAAGDRGEDHLTVDRRPPTEDPALRGITVQIDERLLSFEDETYERPSLSSLARPTEELDELEVGELRDALVDLGERLSSDEVAESDAEGETTQLYSRRRSSQPTASAELIAPELEAELDEHLAHLPVSGDEAVKQRISWLIARARRENEAGRAAVAVVAVDMALREHPDSAVAQKLIHSNRDAIYEIYRSFLGDLGAVPHPAMPMQLIPMQELDHRAAFLLSRVDGVLTLEDVLDVSGMARLEAYRHLSRLLLRGILVLR